MTCSRTQVIICVYYGKPALRHRLLNGAGSVCGKLLAYLNSATALSRYDHKDVMHMHLIVGGAVRQ